MSLSSVLEEIHLTQTILGVVRCWDHTTSIPGGTESPGFEVGASKLSRHHNHSGFAYRADSCRVTAGQVLAPPLPITTSNMSMSDGHSSPVLDGHSHAAADTPASESSLSDVEERPNLDTILSERPDEDEMMDDAVHDMETSQSDEDDDAEGEEDADFDVETPLEENGALRRGSSASSSSSRPNKRKASQDDDGFMLENTELYGLRRSVSTGSLSRLSMANTSPAPRSPKQTSRQFTPWPRMQCERVLTFYHRL